MFALSAVWMARDEPGRLTDHAESGDELCGTLLHQQDIQMQLYAIIILFRLGNQLI